MTLSVRTILLVAFALATITGGSHANATTLRQGGCSTDELVEIYPGYPGFNGYLTGVRLQGRYACPDDLEDADPSFSRRREDAENRDAARELGISGSMSTWTWENWMAIEAERGMVPTCWSCAVLNDDPSQVMPPAGPFDPDDPRLLIGDAFGTSNGVVRYLLRNDLNPSLADQLPNDYQVRALVGMVSDGEHLNSVEVLEEFEALLDFSLEDCCLDPARLWDQLIETGGYVPTPETAVPDDQVFTIYVGLTALEDLMPLGSYQAHARILERSIEEWRLEATSDPSAPSLAEWLRDAGAEDWL